jgi:hypothetical protein
MRTPIKDEGSSAALIKNKTVLPRELKQAEMQEKFICYAAKWWKET